MARLRNEPGREAWPFVTLPARPGESAGRLAHRQREDAVRRALEASVVESAHIDRDADRFDPTELVERRSGQRDRHRTGGLTNHVEPGLAKHNGVWPFVTVLSVTVPSQ